MSKLVEYAEGHVRDVIGDEDDDSLLDGLIRSAVKSGVFMTLLALADDGILTEKEWKKYSDEIKSW